jgi:carbamoylphosphate synthase large subunit
VGGEVQHTRTRELTKLEKSRIDALLSEFKLMGPINVQFMGPDLKLLEINPRFGGGSTASIKAGWTATTWFLQEYVLGHSQVNQGNDFKHVEVMRAWKDYVWR